jgi:hypothetical protein
VPSNRKHGALLRRTVAGALVLCAVSTGCSKKVFDDRPATIAPAQPAASPPLRQPPVGSTRPLGSGAEAAMFDARTRRLVVLFPGPGPTAPASLAVIGPQQIPVSTIVLPASATGLIGDDAGTAYLATRGGYLVVDLSAGRASRVGLPDADTVEFSAITRRSDATLVLGTADGSLYFVKPGAAAVTRTPVHARVDSLVAQNNTVSVLDRGQTMITTVGAGGRIGQSLRAGQGATTMAADPAGRLLVSDTRGGQLLVFGVDPLILRQAYPVAESPYGLAGSSGLAWVSQTSANSVVGYDLSTGIPQEKVRYPSVRQPNLLAFDGAAGTLYVVSGSGEGVQIIDHAATVAR